MGWRGPGRRPSGGGPARRTGGGRRRRGPVAVEKPRFTFKCLTCTLKEGKYDEDFINNHKKDCREAQKKRQIYEADRAAHRQKKAAAHRRPNKKK